MLTLQSLIALLNEAKCIALVGLTLFDPYFSGIEFNVCDVTLDSGHAVCSLQYLVVIEYCL